MVELKVPYFLSLWEKKNVVSKWNQPIITIIIIIMAIKRAIGERERERIDDNRLIVIRISMNVCVCVCVFPTASQPANNNKFKWLMIGTRKHTCHKKSVKKNENSNMEYIRFDNYIFIMLFFSLSHRLKFLVRNNDDNYV